MVGERIRREPKLYGPVKRAMKTEGGKGGEGESSKDQPTSWLWGTMGSEVWPIDEEEKSLAAPPKDESEWRYVENTLRVAFQSEEEGMSIHAIKKRIHRNSASDQLESDPFISYDDQREK